MKNLPNKIYVTADEDNAFVFTKKRTDNAGVEYVRKDAFIKKACEYLMEYEFNDSPTIADRRKRVEDFKKYIEDIL